ncbi:MAG: plasmid pRiA4b ORF-3 family protein [Holophagales bacterium]|jgi:hypothetical protein|nr:plasmid pRiA4b ORF-3 family protein [Holophagales bacterium]
MANNKIYQIYAELYDFEPVIWRRFQVKSDVTVARLGYIVQILFEMRASHLMAIEVDRSKNILRNNPKLKDIPNLHDISIRYEIPSKGQDMFPDLGVHSEDATKARLHAAVEKEGDELQLNYDFGDDWWVLMRLEKILLDKDLPDDTELPRVLDGAGFGIVEDVGGTWGLAELAKAFKKKKGADYKHFCEWVGIKNFDFTAFDVDDMNFRLKKIPRIYKQIYEDKLYPTKKSIDLIERKYLSKKP